MKLLHLPDGRSIGDTNVLVALTARPAAAVRRHCHRLHDGYDIAACTETLDGAPDPILVSAPEAETWLKIPKGTVYSWAGRGRLRALDHSPDGRQPLYDVGDLLELREKGTPA